jgi:16S rRNA (guanine966-N2)-methyltransferase
MRIIGGRLRGRALAPVGAGDEAARLRPTSDRQRQALFNLLDHGDWPTLEGARVLDLFAGTGALGFEALSRGAAHAILVDDGAVAGGLIRRNAALLGVRDAITLWRADATRPGRNPGPPAMFVFLDPPWGKGLGEKALPAALAGGWIAAGAVVAWEDSAPADPPPGFVLRDRRSYGAGHLTLLSCS